MRVSRIWWASGLTVTSRLAPVSGSGDWGDSGSFSIGIFKGRFGRKASVRGMFEIDFLNLVWYNVREWGDFTLIVR